MRVFHSAEEVLAFLEATSIVGPSFELAIADGFTFGGHPDVVGAGMAVVLDEVLASGYEPDGFDQYDSYRLYRYKLFE